MSKLLELIKERFPSFTAIQEAAIPRILSGGNVLIISPTGSGKTEAALLPVLEKIQNEESGINALYIVPLRALNRDLYERFDWWCERLGISHAIRHGDTPQKERAKHSSNPPKIMLTTIEMLQSILVGKKMKEHLKNLKFVIVDEVHDVMDNKRGAQLSMALERLEELTSEQNVRSEFGKLSDPISQSHFQRIGISATIANEKEAALLVFGFRDYSIADAGKKRRMNIEVEYIGEHKKRISRLEELTKLEKNIIFVNTRSTGEELSATLKEKSKLIDIHHGSLSKEVRIEAEKKFKNGELTSLMATSSLELGIDVGDVSLVIQYGSPRTVSRLVQRIGRSGHSLDKIPKGIIIAPDYDDYLEAEVIKTLALNGWLEDKKVEVGALDVIAHQVVGIVLREKMNLKDVHKILNRAYSYGISIKKLKLIALQLYSEGIIFFDEQGDEIFIRARSHGYGYYFSNLSTIPKQKKFRVRNIQSNKIISILDERFVNNLEIGDSFLSKGQAWTVIDIEDEVQVSPVGGTEILIPEWIGEEIPIPYEVAQDVGKLRKSKKIAPLPNDKKIILELVEDVLVIHGCFGNKVNESLGRIISYNISKRIGENVQMVADAYRIIIKLPYSVNEKYLLEAIDKIGDVRSVLERSLEHSFLLKLKFLHVGRLFGLLNEEAMIGHRFIAALKNSVVYEETIRSIFFRYFDLERTEEVVEKIKQKKIEIILDKRKEFSYFAQLAMNKFSKRDSLGSFEPRKKMIEGFRENILRKIMNLKCLNCGATRYMYLAGAPEEIKCHNCDEKAYSIPGKDEQYSANLIRNYGKKALIALASYGIGPRTAESILKRLHRTEEEFYFDLIEAQKNFVKNKKYWKI